MLTKFALLTFASFGLGMLVPIPDDVTANQSAAQVEIAPEPTFIVERAIVHGDLVLTYRDVDTVGLTDLQAEAKLKAARKAEELAAVRSGEAI